MTRRAAMTNHKTVHKFFLKVFMIVILFDCLLCSGFSASSFSIGNVVGENPGYLDEPRKCLDNPVKLELFWRCDKIIRPGSNRTGPELFLDLLNKNCLSFRCGSVRLLCDT